MFQGHKTPPTNIYDVANTHSIYTHMYTYICVYIHVYIYKTCIYVYTHMCIYTHTHVLYIYVIGVMKMGITVPRAGLEPTSLAFRASYHCTT